MDCAWSRLPGLDRVSAGFALAALVLVTVAVVAPELDGRARGDARAAALQDVNAIAMALRAALAEAPEALGCDDDGAAPRYLFGPGVIPGGGDWAGPCGAPLSSVLLARGAASRPSSALEEIPIDPWARAYVVGFDHARVGAAIVVVSAGPDGVVQSCDGGRAIMGDDVGIVLEP